MEQTCRVITLDGQERDGQRGKSVPQEAGSGAGAAGPTLFVH